MSRDRAARKLVGLITRRSQVQILLPQPVNEITLDGWFFLCYFRRPSGWGPRKCPAKRDFWGAEQIAYKAKLFSQEKMKPKSTFAKLSQVQILLPQPV